MEVLNLVESHQRPDTRLFLEDTPLRGNDNLLFIIVQVFPLNPLRKIMKIDCKFVPYFLTYDNFNRFEMTKQFSSRMEHLI